MVTDRPAPSSGGCSIAGGYVYSRTAYLATAGIYFLSGYRCGVIASLGRGSGGAWKSNSQFAAHFLVSIFGLGQEGGAPFVAKYAPPGANLNADHPSEELSRTS
jgi:hypothetical protein